MSIDKMELLEKIIYIQSCIIEGHNMKAILRKDTSFFKEASDAEAIIVCMENEEHVEIEFVLEEDHQFLSLLRKYKVSSKHMRLSKFIEQCNSHFTDTQERIKITQLYDIFQGTVSQKKSLEFEKEMNFDRGELYPIRNKKGKKIGFVLYFFSKESESNATRLLEMTYLFQMLVRAFYDEKKRVLRARCVQVDEKMQRLTAKEKLIAQRVLQGKTHILIAQETHISINTLKTHMKNIFSKYGVSSKIELHNKLTSTV